MTHQPFRDVAEVRKAFLPLKEGLERLRLKLDQIETVGRKDYVQAEKQIARAALENNYRPATERAALIVRRYKRRLSPPKTDASLDGRLDPQ